MQPSPETARLSRLQALAAAVTLACLGALALVFGDGGRAREALASGANSSDRQLGYQEARNRAADLHFEAELRQIEQAVGPVWAALPR